MAAQDDSTENLRKLVLWLTEGEIDRLMRLLEEHPDGFVSFREYLQAVVKFEGRAAQ
jgi:hypothetical protein